MFYFLVVVSFFDVAVALEDMKANLTECEEELDQGIAIMELCPDLSGLNLPKAVRNKIRKALEKAQETLEILDGVFVCFCFSN